MDLTGQYNTSLSPQDEAAFQKWAQAKKVLKSLYDYDVRGFWNDKDALAESERDPRGHGTDRYKKPNHPTFSDESIYSNRDSPGGRWDKWGYVPSPQMSTNLPRMQSLVPYMQNYEPQSGFDPIGLPANLPTPQPMGYMDLIKRLRER